MEFLKILLSTLIIALITALVFFALYFIFPTVAESQFGVSVDFAPERVPSASLNGRLAAEREKADEAIAPPVREEKKNEPVVTEPSPAEKAGPAPVPEKEEEVKKAEPAPESVKKAEVVKEGPKAALTEGGEAIREFMESTKMKIVMSFVPEEYASALKSPADWNDHDIEQINRIGDYITEHGIDIEEETKVSNILKIVNSKEIPEHLQGLLDFVQNEVQF